MRKDQTMKRKRFTEEQIIGILKEHELGAKTADVCRKHGISEATAMLDNAALKDLLSKKW